MIKLNHRVYWITDDEVLGGFVNEITANWVVVSPDRHDTEAFWLAVPLAQSIGDHDQLHKVPMVVDARGDGHLTRGHLEAVVGGVETYA